jgi:hypothetical protein
VLRGRERSLGNTTADYLPHKEGDDLFPIELKIGDLFKVNSSCRIIRVEVSTKSGSETYEFGGYTPEPGSSERAAIMAASRAAQRTSVRFKVEYYPSSDGTIRL